MKRAFLVAALWLLLFGTSRESEAALAVVSSFNPSNASDLCGLGVDPKNGEVWVYGCSLADVQRYSPAGVYLSAVTRPGESANDVDVELAPVEFTLESTLVGKGSLLFINGETGVAEIYAVDKTSSSVLETLNTAFGVSHVVGGAYHPGRSSLFLVQDSVPAVADRNRIAEINPATGAVLNSFQTTPAFSVFFGDVDVCRSTGNLLVVSSSETSIAEFTADGAFVQYHALPAGVSSLSGIGVDDSKGEIWVAGNGGVVWRMNGDACPQAAEIPILPELGLVGLALLLVSAVAHARRA